MSKRRKSNSGRRKPQIVVRGRSADHVIRDSEIAATAKAVGQPPGVVRDVVTALVANRYGGTNG